MDARQRETPGGLTLRDLEENTLVSGLGVPFCESLLSSFRFSSEKCGQVFHVLAKIQFIDKKRVMLQALVIHNPMQNPHTYKYQNI